MLAFLRKLTISGLLIAVLVLGAVAFGELVGIGYLVSHGYGQEWDRQLATACQKMGVFSGTIRIAISPADGYDIQMDYTTLDRNYSMNLRGVRPY